jgi:hypothetical protein
VMSSPITPPSVEQWGRSPRRHRYKRSGPAEHRFAILCSQGPGQQ